MTHYDRWATIWYADCFVVIFCYLLLFSIIVTFFNVNITHLSVTVSSIKAVVFCWIQYIAKPTLLVILHTALFKACFWWCWCTCFCFLFHLCLSFVFVTFHNVNQCWILQFWITESVSMFKMFSFWFLLLILMD